MLRHTFCHIPGIGPRTESALWGAGILTWEGLLAQPALPASRLSVRRSCADHVRESVRHYAAGNPAYFGARLPAGQRWRLFHDFRGSCAYLDIETTGLGMADAITTICLYDGRRLRSYVRGNNLDAFPQDVRDYDLLVTYNGSTFDLPFLARHFGTGFEQAHIDLRFVLGGLGIRGGLKGCERQLGVGRPGMEELDGYTAVLLWREYQRGGGQTALETLLAYNTQDVLNLERLMVEAHNRNVAGTPFADGYRLPQPPVRRNPFPVDAALVRRLLGGQPWRLPFRVPGQRT
jgi:uncharacterized protein YprB with RNaseH-like and TPR domain